ncbi:hypothetical protein [Bradyrhizobium sp. McL0615]|uniref:hypothetical protein n=1 Tax=Bradyrhizobium sp. McL0615 TaxID=3415673 RepID=UPI003CF93D91
MDAFVTWFNDSGPGGTRALPALTRAGIAHLYFVRPHLGRNRRLQRQPYRGKLHHYHENLARYRYKGLAGPRHDGRAHEDGRASSHPLSLESGADHG